MTDTKSLVEAFLKNGGKVKNCDSSHDFGKKKIAKYEGFANEYKSR